MRMVAKDSFPFPRWVVSLGLVLSGVIVALGTYWAFLRGGKDFDVFYGAWRLALTGFGTDIYTETPDRYLYAPGFAWVLAPIGLLPRNVALALWCLTKAAALSLVIRLYMCRMNRWGVVAAAWSCVFLAKPLLIDFQYGQVNVLILAACVWALVRRYDNEPPSFWDFFRWLLLAMAAVAKLFPLPLLLVPFFITAGIKSGRLRLERGGVIIGLLALLCAPLTTQTFRGTYALMRTWTEALAWRGFPLESHNQSFAAFLYHYFGSLPTHVPANGWMPVNLATAWLTDGQLKLLAVAWSLAALAVLGGWMISAKSKSPLYWIAVLLVLIILPLHLVWKPYAVFAIPVGMIAIQAALKELFQQGRSLKIILVGVVFAGINLSSYDFIGQLWSARLEAASILLMMQLLLLVLVWRGAGSSIMADSVKSIREQPG